MWCHVSHIQWWNMDLCFLSELRVHFLYLTPMTHLYIPWLVYLEEAHTWILFPLTFLQIIKMEFCSLKRRFYTNVVFFAHGLLEPSVVWNGPYTAGRCDFPPEVVLTTIILQGQVMILSIVYSSIYNTSENKFINMKYYMEMQRYGSL